VGRRAFLGVGLAAALASGCAVDASVWDPVPESAMPEPLDLVWPPDAPLPAEFDTPPWLTMPAPGMISVGWWTAAESTARVELTQVDGAGGASEVPILVEETEPALLHHALLGPLPAATGFHYRVTLDGSGAAREGVFRTPGSPSWRFIHLAELHAPSQADRAARFADEIRAFQPDLAIESGDMVDDGDDPDGWRSYLRTSQPWISNVILLPAHSNHVNGFLGNQSLLGQFDLPGNGRWYATRFGQVEIMTLDSTYDGESPDLGVELDWADQQVVAARDGLGDPRFVIGAWHYPACSSHYPGRTGSRRWVIDQLLPAFAGAGGLDLILVGHDKYYERSLLEDGTGRQVVHVMANAGMLSPSDEGDGEPECSPQVTRTDTNSMVLVEVDDDRMEAQVIDPDGVEIDRFTIGGVETPGR